MGGVVKSETGICACCRKPLGLRGDFDEFCEPCRVGFDESWRQLMRCCTVQYDTGVIIQEAV